MLKSSAFIEINTEHLKHNVQILSSLLPSKCKLMAVVKANAYGHGDAIISHQLHKLGIDTFAVANLAEGIHLRESGITGDILILGYTLPKEASTLAHYALTQTIIDSSYAKELNSYQIPLKVHIKLDTGMHRLGESYHHFDNIKDFFQLPNLQITGTFSHLCMADSPFAEDVAFTQRQISHFLETTHWMTKNHYNPGKIHIQGSYGILNYPDIPCDYARPGIALYGAFSCGNDRLHSKINLKPVLSLKARIASIRQICAGETVGYGRAYHATNPTTIATVTLGYADGLPRNFSNEENYVLVHGKMAPIIGRICMDQFMIDITGIDEVHTGDIITIIGSDGTQRILAESIADHCGTITNELLCRLGERPDRVILASA